MVVQKWRLDHISCFKHEEESSSHCNAFEHVEVQKNEGLRKAESDELKANGKHWLSSIQKVLSDLHTEAVNNFLMVFDLCLIVRCNLWSPLILVYSIQIGFIIFDLLISYCKTLEKLV